MQKSPFGEDTQRYWDQRYKLFSRINEGVRLDREALFSVKPEDTALEIAATISKPKVVDGMCGAGGIAIACARAGKDVLAIDSNAERLEMARHNAAIYGVEDRIRFLVGDVRKHLAHIQPDTALYLDPPWGGPDYYKLESFRFSDFSPDMNPVMRYCAAHHIPTIISVPKNFDLNQFEAFGRPAAVLKSFDGERHLFSTIFLHGA